MRTEGSVTRHGKVRDGSAPGTLPVTVYPVGDTVWFVDAGGPLRERMLEAEGQHLIALLEQLP